MRFSRLMYLYSSVSFRVTFFISRVYCSVDVCILYLGFGGSVWLFLSYVTVAVWFDSLVRSCVFLCSRVSIFRVVVVGGLVVSFGVVGVIDRWIEGVWIERKRG